MRVAVLHGRAQPAPDGVGPVLTDAPDADPVLVGPGVAAVVAPAQHDLRVRALAADQPHAHLEVDLHQVVDRAVVVILTSRQRPPGAHPTLHCTIVSVDVQVERIEVAVDVVADDHLVVEKRLTVATVSGEDPI